MNASPAERKVLDPPRRVRGEARRAWSVLAPKLLTAGLFLPIDAGPLEALCESWAMSRLADRRLHATPAGAAWRRTRDQWRQLRDEERRIARQLAADFLVLPRERVHLVDLDVDGEDRELRALFTPGVPLRVVKLTPDERRRLEAWNERARAVGLLPRRPCTPRDVA
jgi:phage terminase small subunit